MTVGSSELRRPPGGRSCLPETDAAIGRQIVARRAINGPRPASVINVSRRRREAPGRHQTEIGRTPDGDVGRHQSGKAARDRVRKVTYLSIFLNGGLCSSMLLVIESNYY